MSSTARQAAAVIAGVSLFIAAGCSTSSTSSSPGSGKSVAPSAAPKVTLVTGARNLDFYTTMTCGAQKAAKEHHVDLTIQGPPNYSLPQQLQVVNAVVQTKPDGLLLVPVDPNGLNAAVKAATSNGTVVVTADGQLSQKLDVANLRSNNIDGGAAAAKALGAALGGKGTLAIEALAPSATYNAERVKGFQDEMKKSYPNITLLSPQYDNGDKTKAAQNVSAQIQAHPNLAGVFGAQQTAGEGAVAAVKATGKSAQIKVAAYDADPSQVGSLRAGNYTVLIAQAPFYEGEQGVKLLAQLLRKEVAADSVKYQQYTPVIAVTKKNVDDPKVQPYLYVSSCKS